MPDAKDIGEVISASNHNDSADADATGDHFEMLLHRASGEHWGFAWNVGNYSRRRFTVNFVSSNSPAGRWRAAQNSKCSSLLVRGCELVEANEATGFAEITEVLAKADVLRLRFLRADTNPVRANTNCPPSMPQNESKEAPGAAPRAEATSPVSFECRVRNTFFEVVASNEGHDICGRERLSKSDPTPIRTLVALSRAERSAEARQTDLDRSAAVSEATTVATAGSNHEAKVEQAQNLHQQSVEGQNLHQQEVDGRSLHENTAGAVRQEEATMSSEQTVRPLVAPLSSNPITSSSIPAAATSASVAGASPVNEMSDPTVAASPQDLQSFDLTGTKALICGLVQSPQFNGHWCRVEAWDAEMRRYTVQVLLEEPVTAKLRPENLLDPRQIMPCFDQEAAWRCDFTEAAHDFENTPTCPLLVPETSPVVDGSWASVSAGPLSSFHNCEPKWPEATAESSTWTHGAAPVAAQASTESWQASPELIVHHNALFNPAEWSAQPEWPVAAGTVDALQQFDAECSYVLLVEADSGVSSSAPQVAADADVFGLYTRGVTFGQGSMEPRGEQECSEAYATTAPDEQVCFHAHAGDLQLGESAAVFINGNGIFAWQEPCVQHNECQEVDSMTHIACDSGSMEHEVRKHQRKRWVDIGDDENDDDDGEGWGIEVDKLNVEDCEVPKRRQRRRGGRRMRGRTLAAKEAADGGNSDGRAEEVASDLAVLTLATPQPGGKMDEEDSAQPLRENVMEEDACSDFDLHIPRSVDLSVDKELNMMHMSCMEQPDALGLSHEEVEHAAPPRAAAKSQWRPSLGLKAASSSSGPLVDDEKVEKQQKLQGHRADVETEVEAAQPPPQPSTASSAASASVGKSECAWRPTLRRSWA
eukprot:gnl/TRDRNA2_/TRDRNA2_165490_c5_seq1.p1 gnl/TRDRNA2_/TRDRNA2_165490_c5~~gnl/TRDRNA2_/TRDRNA2_165490_c5_seq1.p1  ORF type:complete len:923 (-),score=176.59 gnl/TRDRNA2_/TRDRNA2_165490_c5_seq1:101-2725(-)